MNTKHGIWNRNSNTTTTTNDSEVRIVRSHNFHRQQKLKSNSIIRNRKMSNEMKNILSKNYKIKLRW